MRTVELTIQDIAFGGKGVGRDNGKAVFVPFTIDGEIVTAEIVREKKQFADAEVLDVQQASEHRIAPPCPYFRRCGGCAYQHINYEHQLQIKWRQVRDVVRRIGKIAEPPMRPIVASPQDYGYRNRITVHVKDGMIGFFRRESNRLVDIERCPISADELNQDLQILRKSNPREGHYTLRAENRPRIFTQTNDAVAERLLDIVIGLMPESQELLIDAYCGAGFFAKALVDKFQKVIGIDWDRFAIEQARRGSNEKETYIAGDVEKELSMVETAHRAAGGGITAGQMTQPSVWPLSSTAATCIIVDPPATGLTGPLRQSIINLAPAILIYVSCNPATLARDLKHLGEKFAIESVTPLDMFPQTAEIEVVAHFKRGRRADGQLADAAIAGTVTKTAR
jgi:23S rRNA (uracil1939-C5)-methyltransferase